MLAPLGAPAGDPVGGAVGAGDSGSRSKRLPPLTGRLSSRAGGILEQIRLLFVSALSFC